MNQEEMVNIVETNVKLTEQLKNYNNQLAGTRFMMVLTIVILIIIMIRLLGWI